MPLPDKKKKRPQDNEIIDVSPDAKPRNLTETEAWKTSRRGASRFWANYKALLKGSFERMNREEQEDLIIKFSIIITMGVTVLITLVFYSVMPSFVRIIAVPVALVVAWWAGRNIIAQTVIARIESKLNR